MRASSFLRSLCSAVVLPTLVLAGCGDGASNGPLDDGGLDGTVDDGAVVDGPPPSETGPLPAPACAAAGGTATVSAPALKLTLKDRWEEGWLGSPAVADLDGDGKAEVIFTSWPENGGGRVGQLHILDALGNPLHALDLPAPYGDDWNGGLGAPTVANIDADADMELVIGTTSSGVVAYDLPGTAGAQCRWCTGRGSNRRTGAAAVSPAFTLSVSPGVRAVARGGSASYRVTVSPEGGFGAGVSFSLSAPSGVSAQLTPGSLTPPGQATLTVSDTSPAGPALPGAWRTITMSATGGGKTRTASAKLLVGGAQTFLPLARRP